MFVTSISGSNKSERCKTSNRNIANLGRILNQEVAIFEDPKRPKKQELTSKGCGWEEWPIYDILLTLPYTGVVVVLTSKHIYFS